MGYGYRATSAIRSVIYRLSSGELPQISNASHDGWPEFAPFDIIDLGR